MNLESDVYLYSTLVALEKWRVALRALNMSLNLGALRRVVAPEAQYPINFWALAH